MPRYCPDPILPEHLEDFPWADQLYLWDFGLSYHNQGTRIKIYYPWEPPYAETPQEYHVHCLLRHHEVWDWLSQRFKLTGIPELEFEGRTWWAEQRQRVGGEIVEPGQQIYEQLACYGTFYVGGRL